MESGPAILFGNILTLTGSGPVIVAAVQNGNARYRATRVTQSFNVASPVIVVMSGDDQTTVASRFNAQPFDVAVWNAAGTQPLVNWKVKFSVVAGGGGLATTNTGTPAISVHLERLTDEEGTVQVFYKHASDAYVLSEIRAAVGSAEATLFSQSTMSGDDDGNGLQDGWEMLHFGQAAVNSLADPDADGLNNGQEFLRGTNPLQADTDGDGVSDGNEAAVFRDPLERGDDASLPTNVQLVIKLPGNVYKGVKSDWSTVPVVAP